MIRATLFFMLFFVATARAQDESEFASVFSAVTTSVVATEEAAPQDGQRVETSVDRFHRALIAAAAKQVRDGKMKRGDLIRLRVAMLSPSFRKQAEDLAVIQMAASGSDGVPVGDDGRIDRASIDWDALFAFLEKLLPLILQLIDALSVNDLPQVHAVA